jgi:hypothetical protein
VVVAGAGQEGGETARALVVHVVVTVAAQGDQVVAAGAQYLDDLL